MAVTASALVEGAVTVLEMLQGRTLIEFGDPAGLDARFPRLGARAGRPGLRAAGAAGAGAGRPLSAWTEHTITDPARLTAEVEAVRRQGWATAADRVLVGVNALAAPVLRSPRRLARRHRASSARPQFIAGAARRTRQIAQVTERRRRRPRDSLDGGRAECMSYSLAVDIGGTFTDVVLRGADGSLTVDKTLTTHHDLLEGFFRGVDLVLAKAGVDAGDDRRRRGARHHRGHQRADRAQGPADGADHHQGLPRRALDPQRAPLRDVRSADRVRRRR